jgi:hypothetical protein
MNEPLRKVYGKYYIKVIKMGTMTNVECSRDKDGVYNLGKMENVSFTMDGLGRNPDRFNCFSTPREALLTFAEMLNRHPDFNYVDIVMAEAEFCII